MFGKSHRLIAAVTGVAPRRFGKPPRSHEIELVRENMRADQYANLDFVTLIRAHLADELELNPDKIQESTRFREDLEADSLDLYTLVQELEDSYGVRISDEEAAKILTVGQAVDFVLASGVDQRSATASQGPDTE